MKTIEIKRERLHPKMRLSSYKNNPLSPELEVARDDGSTDVITVNLGPYTGNSSLLMPFWAFVDTNNAPWAPEFILENDLGEPVTRFGEPVTARSGLCEFPLYSFKRETLERICGTESVGRYFRGYKEAFPLYQLQVVAW